MTLRQRVRRCVESRFPEVASAYRAFREDLYVHRLRDGLTPFGFRLAADAATRDGSFEASEIALLRELLPAADVFVDVGANVGFYTCLARRANKRVVAIEPLPSNLRVLYRNLELNGWTDVEVWPVGLAGSRGISRLYGGRTGASLLQAWSGGSIAYTTSISVTTLDDLLRGRYLDARLLVKIDVEGAELQLLRGALDSLARTPAPTWLVEITLDLNRAVPNQHFADTFALFWDRGYETQTGDPERRLVQPADVEEWARAGHVEGDRYNWLFTRSRKPR